MNREKLLEFSDRLLKLHYKLKLDEAYHRIALDIWQSDNFNGTDGVHGSAHPISWIKYIYSDISYDMPFTVYFDVCMSCRSYPIVIHVEIPDHESPLTSWDAISYIFDIDEDTAIFLFDQYNENDPNLLLTMVKRIREYTAKLGEFSDF